MNNNNSRVFVGEKFFQEMIFNFVEVVEMKSAEGNSTVMSGEMFVSQIATAYHLVEEEMTRSRLGLIRQAMVRGFLDSFDHSPEYAEYDPDQRAIIARILADSMLARGAVIGERRKEMTSFHRRH